MGHQAPGGLTDEDANGRPALPYQRALAYPTEKNPALLQRIIAASSNPGDLVLDCFSGSGTTLTKMWYNSKWLNRVMADEHLLTSLPPAGADDLVLEPGLVVLTSPRGLNEVILELEAPGDDGGEELSTPNKLTVKLT